LADDPTDKVTFHYIKSPTCADVPVHGAFGGINPKTGTCYMAVFAERPPIPKEIEATFKGGVVVDEKREGKGGIIRSVNAILHFDINAAIALRAWLDDKIESFKKENPTLFNENEK
jgi:hypothetical protein